MAALGHAAIAAAPPVSAERSIRHRPRGRPFPARPCRTRARLRPLRPPVPAPPPPASPGPWPAAPPVTPQPLFASVPLQLLSLLLCAPRVIGNSEGSAVLSDNTLLELYFQSLRHPMRIPDV
ncbi:uncharacterized protein LOC134434622 [Melospiza melodia melodia]|uniref:uncharacterized protein LOC134422732 n=1 Tax=Melospiza melodia melodia TaxID=1914991 RepID=UPI002FD76FA9